MRRFGLCLVVALASHKAWAESPPVKVELRTSWAPPPYVVEVLETLSLEEPQSFFPVLNALTNSEWLPSVHTTDEQTYRKVLEVALGEDYLAFPGELASFNAMLALHSANPRLQAAYQYYLDNHGARNHACGSWVDWYGEVICDKDTLRELVSTEAIEAAAGQLANSSYAHPTVLPFDHVNPSADSVLDRPPRTAILYAALDSPNFRDLHEFLYEASNAPTPHVEYVLRHVPPKDHASNEARTFLSGYGVALDLKKMDYLALDDRRQGGSGTEGTSKDASKSALEADPIVPLLQQYPEAVDVDYSTPLTKDELLEISIQAAQLIGDSEDKLATLKQLSQSFPKYASSIARRVTVNEGLAEEVQSNMEKVQGGINAVWLNGAPINDDNMNPFSLLRLMRKERATMMSLLSLGLKESHAIELLTHRAVGLAQSDTGVLDGIFDASDRPERGNVIVYWNDIENDAKYARWHPSVSVLLNPMYPGQLPNARLNLWNIVFALDLSTPTSVNVIGGPIATIIARGFPFRLGVVPLFTNPESEKMARLMYWLVDQFGSEATLSWFFKVSRRHAETGSILALDWSIISAEFGHFIEDHRDTLSEDVVPDFDAIITGEDEDLARRLDKARAYAERLNLDPAEAPQGHFFVNGKHFVLDDNFMRSTQMIAGQQLQHLQEQLYFGNITEDDAESISTYFYDLPEASRRRNKFIYPSTKPGSLRIENLVDLVETSDLPFSPGSFVYPPESERVPITTIVVADLDSPEGIQFVQEALLSLKDNSLGRLTFIHNPSSPRATESHPVSSVLGHLIFKKTLAQASPATLLEVLGFEDGVASREPSGQTVVSSPRLEQIVMAAEEKLGDLLDGAPLSSPDDETYAAFVMASRFVVRKLKLQPGDQAIIVNGRVVGPLALGDLIAEDIEQLLAYENRKRVGPVVQALEDVVPPIKQYGRDAFAQAVSLASSVISSIHLPDASEVGLFNAPLKPRRRNYQLLGGQYVKSEFGDNSTALYHFGILLDPISEAAQKWSSLLEWLINDPSVYLELYLNPNRYEEIPLKRFYRYNLNSVPQFNEQGEESRPQVVFDALPEEPIYTLAMDIAPSWMVRPREATYDLDNILLSALSENERAHGVYALFDLDYLVIEGHAREGTSMSPPRGLQLQLVAPRADGVATNETTTVDASAPIADTLVVANLGYLQFRAKPGVFRLEIRPGRGREIFALDSVGGEGWESPSVEDGGDAITLMSFEGLTLYPRTARLPGMEEADVLAIDEPVPEDEGIVGKLKTGFSSLFGSKPQTDIVPATGDGEADINIFTVASGLLYERFASIMILSVLRNTKGTVKFWFIENFLSPSFLEFIPHFAAEYNFQYELVTYKWPTWLRAQKEKQRTIWGYKILFLDVLFPMSLKKVIFVDADQIVRADLRELVDLDLHSAPYAYTPMGDDNTDMEGFRFWKTGYWKDFLGPLKYHISALYIVDLVRFRQMAAGDMLRAHYQGLSADPNSLANLDQDLPNNLQREVPIFSLNEDWLWCETWCSKDRLDRAKTIDLCQNPLTKEPKLARAKHIPEWESYDSEIARFAHSLAERGVIRAGMADADATKLAEVGAAKAESHPGVEGDGEGADKIERQTAEGRPKDEL